MGENEFNGNYLIYTPQKPIKVHYLRFCLLFQGQYMHVRKEKKYNFILYYILVYSL